ncbi:MAG: HEAT repeat domain-containing protein [Phycisphaerae bacterium]
MEHDALSGVPMGYGIEFLVALIILLNGARSDLLDAIPTGAYWRAKGITVTLEQLERDAGPEERVGAVDALIESLGSPEFKKRAEAREKLAEMGPRILPQLEGATNSKNPEVRAVAAEIARRFEAKGKERSVRRLMAIRTLGERHEKGALDLLKSLENSKEMFVAEYAQRAVAQIEGRPWKAPDRSALIANDWQLMPRHTGIIGQTVGLAAAPVTLDTLYRRPAAPPKPGPDGQPSPNEAEAKAMASLLPILERIGNVRIDGVTAALSDDAGETTGWELTIIRGQFDAAALRAAARVLAHPADGVVKFGTEHGIPIVQTDVDTHIMFPSDQMMIFVMADEDNDRFARMLAMIYALQAGHGQVTGDKNLSALISRLPPPGTGSRLWLAGTFNAEEKKLKLLAGVDSFVASAVDQKEGIALTLRAAGGNARELKGSVDEMTTNLRWLQQVMPQVAPLLPIAAFVGSVRAAVGPDGKEATVTAQMKPELAGSVLGLMLPALDLKPQEQQAGAGNGPAVAPNAPAVVPAQ